VSASVGTPPNIRVNLTVRPVTGAATAAAPAPVRPAGCAGHQMAAPTGDILYSKANSAEHRILPRLSPQNDPPRHGNRVYRGAKILRDGPEGFWAFRIKAESPSPGEIVAHMGDLFDWDLSIAKGKEVWRDSPLGHGRMKWVASTPNVRWHPRQRKSRWKRNPGNRTQRLRFSLSRPSFCHLAQRTVTLEGRN
jgi:hypothetical protein